MVNFTLLFLVIFVLVPQDVYSKISDKRRCANESCTERISLAKTVLRYNSPEERILSVPANVEVTVYSKSAGTNSDLWGVEYNGKRGYLNKNFLRETKVFKKTLPFLVNTESEGLENVPSSDYSQDISPNQQIEIVDGTTITHSPNDINPSATDDNVKPTESVLNIVNADFNLGLLKENEIEGNKHAESVDNDVDKNINIEDSENEDDETESDEDDEDDEDDEEAEDEKDAIKEEKTEEQIVPDPEGIKGELNLSESELENTKESTNEEEIFTKGSVTSRNLLQVEDGLEETPPSIEELKKEIKNTEDVLMKSIDEKDEVKSEEITSQETSSENPQLENIVVTTESVINTLFDDSANIESVTENPGKLENIEEIKENVEQKEEKVDDGESGSFWGFGFGDINKDLDSKLTEEGNVEVPKDDNVKLEEKIEVEYNLNKEVPEVIPEQEKENILKSDLLTPSENIDNLEKTNENIESGNTNFEENKAFENIPKIEPNLDESIPKNLEQENETIENSQNTISNDEVTEDFEASVDIRKPIPEIPLNTIPEIPITNNENQEIKNESYFEENLDLQNSLNKLTDDIIVTNPEVPIPPQDQPTNPQENSIEQSQESEKQQESYPPENSIEQSQESEKQQESYPPENSIEQSQESENKQQEPSGWYNNFFGGGATENAGINENNNDNAINEGANAENENLSSQGHLENTEPNLNSENTVENEKIEHVHVEQHEHNFWTSLPHSKEDEKNDVPAVESIDSCSADADDCSNILGSIQKQLDMDLSSISFTDVLNLVTVLGITGITVVVFLLGYIAIDKSRRETPLVAKINKLEKALLVSTKENQILAEKVAESESETNEKDIITSQAYTDLENCNRELMEAKVALEEQVQSLEKELENSTEVGFELNRMLSEILKSQSGSDMLVANVESLQRQLVEQQSTINSINATLNLKDTENHELQLELDIKNKKVVDLQAELDKMALNLMKAEEEKDQIQSKLEIEIQTIKEELDQVKSSHSGNKNKLTEEINSLKKRCGELQKALDLKSSEYNILKENFNQIKTVKNNQDLMKDLLQSVSSKAELAELQKENKALNELLAQERQIKVALEQRTEEVIKEMGSLKDKYDDADKEKLEAQTKLEVLGNYFKEREAELQRELAKQEALWQEKQGEATSSTERIRYIKEELQNVKSQNELLKQEIVSQEVELKSQISVLEKKAHESWLSARQAERRLEDAKQEAAQLRNRLTLKERSFVEDKGQHRVQSPLEQNGDITSPLHMSVESPASPPLLYSTRDHLTTSPPLPGLPPFLPPPPGIPPFMPPPIPGVPGFMPPPPSMFPIDHRPPPLGRISSPPLNSRYSPDSSRYSDRYDDRNSPSPPPYDDDDHYEPNSPVHRHRPYSPYRNDRREYKRSNVSGGRTNGRNKGASSGSENSNSETIDRAGRHHAKI